ncbi:MAG TPA: hypothetical protein VD931_19795 [Baekduia sp.]|nr:hypothetical protein [Baekduia sp.]
MRLARGHIKAASFAHSAVYLGLLVVWLGDGPEALNAFFGWAHGLGWFVMCGLAITGLRRRLIDLRLAVAIAVLGAVGPFLGTAEFIRQDRMRHFARAR